MVDLDSTQIINAEESILQDVPSCNTEVSFKIISGFEPNTYTIKKETIIGRASPSDLIIAAQSLSKQHAKITFNNGQCFITDLGSSNKTYQNKTQLQPNVCYALHDGDEIKFGDVVCGFHEEKLTKDNDNVLSRQDSQIYVPVENTLVDEDSPWDDDDGLPSSNCEPNHTETIPSTQTITDSYDEDQPTQPVKIWNGNNNHVNRISHTSIKSSDDSPSKKNGCDEPSSNGSSLLPNADAATVAIEDPDDGNLVIGASTLPATVPLDVESKETNEEEKVEITSTTETKTVIEENIENDTMTIETTTTTTTKISTEIEIDKTQAYELEPVAQEDRTDEKDIPNTQIYDLQAEPVIVKDVLETKKEEVHTVVVEGDHLKEETTKITMTSTTTTTLIEPVDAPMETLAYDLQPMHETVKVEIKTTQMCMDTQVYDLDEQIETKKAIDNSETTEPSATINTAQSEVAEPSVTESSVTDEAHIEPSKADPNSSVDTSVNEDMETEQSETVPMESNVQEQVTASTDATVSMDDDQNKIADIEPETVLSKGTDNDMVVDETNKSTIEINTDSVKEQTNTVETVETNNDTSIEAEFKDNTINNSVDEVETKGATDDIDENDKDEDGDEVEELDEESIEASKGTSTRVAKRGMPRRNVRRARGRRGTGAAGRARVVSTKIYGGRRNQIAPVSADNADNNATLEETIQSENEESPQKTTTTRLNDVESKTNEAEPTVSSVAETKNTETTETSETSANTNIRVSARIKARASSGRNRQFPYTDDYVDLDDLEKQTKAANAVTNTTSKRSSRGGRASATPQKRISLRQQPVESSESPEEKETKQRTQSETNEDMDTGGENEEPNVQTTGRASTRKRKSTTPVVSATTKRTRSMTQAGSANSTRAKETSEAAENSANASTTPRRTRKSTRAGGATNETTEEVPKQAHDRPVRIALSSHLNFDQTHLDALHQLEFEIMDESCRVDALVVDRIRRTKKFFMCLARGAHILAPSWIEAMIKEKSYVPYDKHYLEDTAAETRYGFQLRESVRLAKQKPIFQNYRFFCTKDTSPPYDDLKDIIEAAGGKMVEKVNTSRPGKDLICIVAQNHKNEYEDLHKKGVPIVSEEFALSGVSKQKLDFSSFTLFPNTGVAVKTVTGK